MTKEILEISSWLHDRGFEPDMVCTDYYFVGEGGGVKLQTYMKFADFGQDELPYFTLNRALELLPERTADLFPEGEGLFMVIHPLNETGYGLESTEHTKTVALILSMSKHKDMGMHLAALRLLKKVVEAGYLKGESGE